MIRSTDNSIAEFPILNIQLTGTPTQWQGQVGTERISNDLRRSFERALLSRDDENQRFSNHGLSALVTRQYPKCRRGERKSTKGSSGARRPEQARRYLQVCQRVSLPAGKNNNWESMTLRIGVTAVWHRPQKSKISDGLHENSVLVNASQPPTTTTGLDANSRKVAVSMVANLKLPPLGIPPRSRGGGCQCCCATPSNSSAAPR